MRILSKFLFFAFLLFFNSAFANLASDAEKLFSWGEQKYPSYFSIGETEVVTKILNYKGHDWYYRYYPETKVFLAINELNKVYVLGGVFGRNLLYIGRLEDLLDVPSLAKPSLTTTPTITQDDIVEVEVNGEIGATVFVNGVDSGKTIGSNGKVKVTLDTSGDDGDKSFSITLKDDKGNESEALTFTIKKIHMRSCQSILDTGLSNGDGIYTIDPDGKDANPSFEVYCHDMNTTKPKEYLELKKTGTNYNYGMTKSGGARPGEDIVTQYTKIRINPETLIVDTTDTTFSSTTGILYNNNKVAATYAQYGIASDCITSFSAKGKANIDLTETPFKIHDNLIFDPNNSSGKSWKGKGTSVFTKNRQIVNTTGGGYCGANYPIYDNNVGTLKLDFI
jgi:hypothetical protein